MALIPPALTTGSVLAALSPASPVGEKEVKNGIAELKNEGLDIVVMDNALKARHYLAGDDKERIADLNQAFSNKNIDGIICTRGGYGSLRLLPYIDYQQIAENPKIFIGFSDITALQWALWQEIQLVTFSGSQLAKGWGDNISDFSRNCWLKAVKGEIWNEPLPIKKQVDKFPVENGPARVEGRLLGGNLAMLAALSGTRFSPQFKDAILILEEIDEPDYRIDRMFTQLHLSGALEGVKGLVIGEFIQHTREGINNQSELAVSILSEILPGIPMISGVPYGHVKDTWTIPLGAWAILEVDKGSLSVLNH